jgi:hypothetical protein
VKVLGPELEIGIRRQDGSMQIGKRTAVQVEAMNPWLRRENALGADIYIRPKGSRGLVLLDDLKPEAVNRMKQEGYGPALVVETSASNYQAWVRVSPDPIPKQEATRAAQSLARTYGGDPASADWRHFGRLAGFTNQKPERAVEGRAPFVLLREAKGREAERGPELLERVRGEVQRREATRRVEQIHTTRGSYHAPFQAHENAAAEYRSRARSIVERYPDPDWSRVDWMVSKDMAQAGRDERYIAQGIREGSPNLEERRHRADYPERTAEKVIVEVGRERQQQRQVERDRGRGFER